jgi:hypothetical protein
MIFRFALVRKILPTGRSEILNADFRDQTRCQKGPADSIVTIIVSQQIGLCSVPKSCWPLCPHFQQGEN